MSAPPTTSASRRAIWSWAFIDWANSAFATVMLTALFPVFFKEYWCNVEGVTPERSTFYLTIANGLSSAVIAVMAPLLGSIADQGNAKKKFLLGFTVLGCACTSALPLVAAGHYFTAAALFTLAAIGYSGNVTFADALLTDVAEPRTYDRVSALGYGVGYVGGGVMFAGCVVMIAKPAMFGLADAAAATRWSFALTGAWWLFFTIPALLWIHETPGRPAAGEGSVITRGFRQFAATFKDLRHHRNLLLFLGGYILYSDGVNTVIKMAVTFGMDIGLKSEGLVLAILLVQFVAFPAAVAFGRIGEKFGARRGIAAAIFVYIGVCIYAVQMTSLTEFFAMAVVIGLVQGGIQSLSRSFFARLIPPEKGGEYFGFYNMLGKFSAVIGPPLFGLTGLLLSGRFAILSLLILFGAGLALLLKVREPDRAPA